MTFRGFFAIMRVASKKGDVVMKKRVNLYWLVMPILHCILLIVGYFGVFFFLMDPNNHDWGGIVWSLLFVIFYALVVAPLLAFFYCKKIHRMGLGWTKYLCSLYNSVMMGMYYVVCTIPYNNYPINLKYIMTEVISVPGLSVVIPGFICGVLTLLICDARTARGNRKSDATQ